MTRVSHVQATAWIDAYVHAWQTTEPADIAALYADDAEAYELPYDTSWVGLPEIIAGWRERMPWQEGGWTFTGEVVALTGDTFVVSGLGVYEKLGTFENLWVVTLNDAGKCTMFRMWNNEAA